MDTLFRTRARGLVALLALAAPVFAGAGPDPDAAGQAAEALVARGAAAAEVRARLAAHRAAVAAGEAARARAELRAMFLAHPVLRDHPLLYVVRPQYNYDHHNTETLFHTGEPNNHLYRPTGPLKTVDLRTGRTTVLVDPGPEGAVRDPAVHFDGGRVVFARRKNRDEDYRIWEVRADGSGLRQRTDRAGASDIDPFYLPDDRLAFSSTRERKYCMCNIHIMANLCRMEADGSGVEQIGKNNLFEGHGALLPDGRILYDRWEYVDRNFGDAQGLWTMNPDGTQHAVYFGNNTACPGAVLDAQPVPGTDELLCLFASCHDHPWGALALVDRRRGIDVTAQDRAALVRLWPSASVRLIGRGGIDGFREVRPRYEDPCPLDDAFFLCARELAEADRAAFPSDAVPATGLYLVDRFGNEALLHAEGPGCFDPVPLAPRPRPPVVADRRRPGVDHGVFFVADVYEGTHLQGVARGEVKALRVVESPEKRTWTVPAWGGQGVHRPAMNWHSFENKRILGTAPVEADGSACFEVPAGTFVFFQLLDADGMMVSSMRSGVAARPGELTGCTGCHEPRLSAPPVPAGRKGLLALARPPSKLEGWLGPPRNFSYRREVQPVWDRHCVRCHDFGKEAGRKLILAGDRDLFFNASYESLWQNWDRPEGVIHPVGAGPAEIQPAKSWGAHASRLVRILRAGHHEVKLPPEDFQRVVTWLDLNAVYYPTYNSAYPDNPVGRSPLSHDQVKRLSELTGWKILAMDNHAKLKGPVVSFERPELSPCVQGLDRGSPAFREAVEIIRAGAAALAAKPRGDVEEGFEACPTDQAREEAFAAARAAGRSAPSP